MKNYYRSFLKKSWRLTLSVMFLFFCSNIVSNAQTQSCSNTDPTVPVEIVPNLVLGNPELCTGGLRVDPPNEGTYDLEMDGIVVGQVTIVFDYENTCGEVFSWEVTPGIIITEIVVKASDDANIYDYLGETDPPLFDGYLHSPYNSTSGVYYEVSHIDFCYTYEPPATAPKCSADGEEIDCFNGTGQIVVDVTEGTENGPFDYYLYDDDDNSLVASQLDVTETSYVFLDVPVGDYTVVVVDVNDLDTECYPSITAPVYVPISLVCSDNVSEPACQTQGAIDTKFLEWVGDFSVTGGTEPVAITYTVNGLVVESLVGLTPPDACGGEVIIQIDVVDACEMTESCSRTFEVEADEVPPVISTDAVSEDLGCNPTVEAPEFTGLDNCDGVFTPVVSTDGPVEPDDACGLWSQTWTANYTDACDNDAEPVSITYTWKEDLVEPVISTDAEDTDFGCNPTITAPVYRTSVHCFG